MFQFPAFALRRPMRSGGSDGCCEHPPGFPIRTSPDQRSFASSPELIAGCRVLRRLSMPRHPPYTLNSLTTFIDHRLDPGQNRTNTSTGGAASDHASRRKGARRHPPYGKTILLAPRGGDHHAEQCRGGRRGFGRPVPSAALRGSQAGQPITLNLVIHLSKSEPVFCSVRHASEISPESMTDAGNKRRTSRRTRVSQPCLVGGLIRVRQIAMLLFFCVSRVTG